MTGHVGVDLDRLADFVGGALDGTPDADDVRRLVTSDPGWAAAYSALVEADAVVRADLRTLGAQAPTVPADVLRLLDAALAGAAAEHPADALPRPSGSHGLSVLPGGAADGAAGGRRRQPARRAAWRPLRWAVGVAAAAVVAVCALGSVNLLHHATQTLNSSTGAGQDSAQVAAPQGSLPPARQFASGNDYNPQTLGQIQQAPSVDKNVAPAQPDTTAAERAGGQVPFGLERLSGDPTALAACLNAIVREYGGTVDKVDFAKFGGTPAAVVLLTGARVAPGRGWVVVVGQSCGTNGAITDELYHAAV